MATVTAFTAARMMAIEDAEIVDASVVDSILILHRKDGTSFPVGSVAGTPGPPGVGVEFLDAGESSAGIPDGTKICRRF